MKKSINLFLSKVKELAPVIVLTAVIVAILCIPLRIVSYGYMPPDDAQRHVAKVISGKPWSEILVVRPEFTMDSHPGWHAILGSVYKLTGCGSDGLITFSVVFLFLILCLLPVFFLDFPETWLITLLGVSVVAFHFMARILLARPFIVTMAVIVLISFIWPKLKEKRTPYPVMVLVSLSIAASCWIHASWYLFALPIGCFFIAREFRAGIRLAVCAAAGICLGALFTGHPAVFLKQTWIHMTLAFGSASVQRVLVGEFQPFRGDAMMAVAIMTFILWRKISGKRSADILKDPVFILAVAGWSLGFVAVRFWADWGLPAAIVWIAKEINAWFIDNVEYESLPRIALVFVLSVVLFMAITTDVSGRWTYNLTTEYLSDSDPKQSEWLPGKDGIIYSADMTIFYQTFFRNPHATWKYALGFEPAMMPPDDLATLRKIQWNYQAYQAYEPWVKKMRSNDRLVLRGGYNAKPNISGLEWYYIVSGIWIGRAPREIEVH